LTREDIEETFGIRGVLEGYAARLAAVKHEGPELEPLEEKIREYQACLDRGDLDALPRINTDFHELLYALSRSPRLIRMIADLGDWIHRFRRVILKSRKLAEVSNRDHRLMLAHIRRRDAEGAETRVREHILRGQEAVLKEFDAQRVR
jgi:DNA-binding GntR family transcriptional regulator